MKIYGVDFGAGSALAIHGPNGPVRKRDLALPRVPGGKTSADEFRMVLQSLMVGGEKVPPGDVVIESPTIGSSGCEPQDIEKLLDDPDVFIAGTKVFTIPARAVKNYRMTNNLPSCKFLGNLEIAKAASHKEDAEIIYRIALEKPEWMYEYDPAHAKEAPIERIHRSVRPMDKRCYRDERAEKFMDLLPPFSDLPSDLQSTFGTGRGYSRSLVMPFAMATTEPHLDEGPREDRRRRFEKIIGLYGRGYPSFYRRATIDVMIEVLKQQTGLSRKNDSTAEQRKAAQKESQRQIRKLFHLSMAHQGR
jgi:hypothetical protein